MKCKYCTYYWNDADYDEDADNWARCHFDWNDGEAPCEIDEEVDEDD